MKKNKIFLCLFLFIFMLFGATTCHAQSLAHQKGVYVSANSEEDRNYEYVKLHVPQSGVLGISFQMKFMRETEPVLQQSIGIDLEKIVYDEEFTEQVVENMDYEDIPTIEVEDILDDSFYDKKEGFLYTLAVMPICTRTVEPGDYILTFFNGTGYEWKLTYDISWYSGMARSLEVPSNISFKAGNKYTFDLIPNPRNAFVDLEYVESSDSKHLECDLDNEKITVSADKAGTYTLSIYLENGVMCSVPVNVNKSSKPKMKYTSCELYEGEKIKNYILFNSKKVKWISSNKKIATVNKKGMIQARGIGKCKVIATIGKKKYICKVKVLRQQPDFFACLEDYDRNRNYFTVRIKNNGEKALTIYSSEAKAIDNMYVSFNRNLKLQNNKNIVIKAGQTKRIKFYVKGARTWYDYMGFIIDYKISYDGKAYKCLVGDCMSEYKNKKETTYSFSEDYYYWVDPSLIY